MASPPAHEGLAGEVEAEDGVAAPASATARLRDLLAAELRRGREELAKPRSGYGAPVAIEVASQGGRLLAVTPADAGLRADPLSAGEREWLLFAVSVAALLDLACPPAPA